MTVMAPCSAVGRPALAVSSRALPGRAVQARPRSGGLVCRGLADGLGGSELPPATTIEAFDLAESCMRLFLSGESDAVLAYMPDSVIDGALERKRSKLGDG